MATSQRQSQQSAGSQEIGDLIHYWGHYYNVSPRLATAVFTQESSLDPSIADGTSGEQGLAQLMPARQREFGVTNPYDVNQSIRGGIQYLRQGYDVGLAAGHPNPAAYAVRYYNGGPSGPGRHATDPYIAAVARHYAALPEDEPGGPPTGVLPEFLTAPDRATPGPTASRAGPSTAPWQMPGAPPIVAPAPGLDGAVAPGGGVPSAQRWSVSQWPSPPLPGPDGAVAPGGGAPAARWSVSPEVMNYPGVARGTALGRVDPRLVDIATRASGYLPDGWRAEMISGWRGGPGELRHGTGQALDVKLYDQNGNALDNTGPGPTFRAYEAYMQNARKLQQQSYPELEGRLSWGGYFSPSAKNQADLMHLSLDEPGQAGDWQQGLYPQYRGVYDRGGPASQRMGTVANFQLPAGDGNVAAAAHPSGVGVVATSLPDGRLPAPVAGPLAGGAPPGLQPTSGPLPTNWADVPGVPASMRYAPPSMFTASSPEEQARWNAVSTPQGYEAAVRELAGGGTAGPAPVTPVTRTPLPAVAGTPPVAPVPLPAGTPPTGTAGIPGLPGLPSGPSVRAPPDVSQVQEDPSRSVPTVIPPPPGQSGIAQLEALGRGTMSPADLGFGPGARQPPMPAQAPPAGVPRYLSDERVAKMGPGDVFGILTNEGDNLTDADRAALNGRLTELQQQLRGGQ